jgi:two-component system sensor histidine kinase BaeS
VEKLRIKLFYKFFGIVFLSVFLSHIIAGVSVGYFGKKNFRSYLEKTKIKEFSVMAQNIGKYYEENGGLDKLINRQEPLHIAFMMSGTKDFGTPPGPPDMLEDVPRFPKQHEIFALYDKDMNYLAGGEYSPEDMHIFPVEAEGKTVAHFGALKFDKLPPNPFAEKFLESQVSLLIMTSLIVLAMVTITAWLLTRNMLYPLKKLGDATKRITERDFDVELEITTSDEIAELTCNFQKMINTLKEYEQKQSRWISDISHELRTPLSVILGSIEAIQDGVRKPDADTIESVYKNTMRMKRLVNELHDITMAESGAMHMQMISVDILGELYSLLDFYEVRMAEHNFRISCECSLQNVKIAGDLMRLNQVFINILENAIKYAKSPGVMFVTCKKEEGQLLLSFEDTGPGVEEEHLPFLFDRLYRIDSSRSTTTGGSGLGLSICKFIIEGHNGSISAYKGEKGGLRLDIRLPLETSNE